MESYIIITFFGRLKGEMGERYHLILVASTPDSGVSRRKLVVLLV